MLYQDGDVQKAVTKALMEQGAEKVDFINEHKLSGGEPRVFSVENGWKKQIP